ncbi:hypothetical protein EON65_30915 [archaeon]|nr:MAG: hypothetical protein EON65_30915 [archaeon]
MSISFSRQSTSPFTSSVSHWKQKALFDAFFPDYSTQPVPPAKLQNEDQEIFEDLIGTLKENLVGETPYTNPQISLQEKLQNLQNHPLLRSPTSQRMMSTNTIEHKCSKNKVEILMLMDERSQADSDIDSMSADSLPHLQSACLLPQGSSHKTVSRVGKLHTSQSTGSLPRRPVAHTLPSLLRPVGAVSSVPVIQGTQCRQVMVSTPAVSTRPHRTLPPV